MNTKGKLPILTVTLEKISCTANKWTDDWTENT